MLTLDGRAEEATNRPCHRGDTQLETLSPRDTAGEYMDQLTIYLDGQDGRRAKWFWWIMAAMSMSWILQGLLGIIAPPSKIPFWWPWMNLSVGAVFLGFVLVSLLSRRKYGRMRLVLTELT